MATRSHYLSRFANQADAISFEHQALNIGREYLPPCAIAVLDRAEPSEAYWDWLCEAEAEASQEWADEQAYQATLK